LLLLLLLLHPQTSRTGAVEKESAATSATSFCSALVEK
jgi:hypothetical protein